MQLFHSLCSSWAWHDCSPLSRPISSKFHTKFCSLSVACSCLLGYIQELILYGRISATISAKGFRFWLIWTALVWFWSSWSPEVSSRESQSFLFPMLPWTTMFVGAAACLFISGRMNMPIRLFVTPSWTHTHTQTFTHSHTDPKHLPWRVSQDRYSMIFPPPLCLSPADAGTSP